MVLGWTSWSTDIFHSRWFSLQLEINILFVRANKLNSTHFVKTTSKILLTVQACGESWFLSSHCVIM